MYCAVYKATQCPISHELSKGGDIFYDFRSKISIVQNFSPMKIRPVKFRSTQENSPSQGEILKISPLRTKIFKEILKINDLTKFLKICGKISLTTLKFILIFFP